MSLEGIEYSGMSHNTKKFAHEIQQGLFSGHVSSRQCSIEIVGGLKVHP